jgi:hypothetical protein
MTRPNNGRPKIDASKICRESPEGANLDKVGGAVNETVSSSVLVLFPLPSSVIDAGENAQLAPVGRF